MEESIRRAEKLVHVTNSALAQMKYNLTFDDFDREPEVVRKFERRKIPAKEKRELSLEEELDRFEHDFRSEANEILSKMDKLLDPKTYSSARKSSTQAAKARDKMKEINQKIENHRREQSAINDVDQHRQEEPLEVGPASNKHNFFSKDSETSKQNSIRDIPIRRKESPPRKSESLPTIDERRRTKTKAKDDLKTKLRETQEIVDRGFQTARQLSQKVENMTKLEKKSEKTPSSLLSGMTGSRSLELIRQSESNETIKSVDERKCIKCHGIKDKRKRKEKKRERQMERESREEAVRVREDKNQIVNIRRVDSRRIEMPKLKLESLPSLSIKGGLQLQKVHNLEIPPETNEIVSTKSNTAIQIISHEEMEKKKVEKILEEVRKENCFCFGNETKENCIECFNCGKLIRVREKMVDPREIDKLLLKCDFNVFDPRIDEFVERCHSSGVFDKLLERRKEKRKEKINKNDGERKKEKTKCEMESNASREEPVRETCKKEVAIQSVEEMKVQPVRKTFKIEELSKQLTKKYKERADKMEDDHLEFENILRSLFKKVDESRELFDDCHFLSTKRTNFSKKVKTLSATKPVVVSLTDEIEPDEKAEKREDELKKTMGWSGFSVKVKRKKLDKKDVKNKHKSRTIDEIIKPAEIFRKKEVGIKAELEKNSKRPPEVSPPSPPMSLTTKIFNAHDSLGDDKAKSEKNGKTSPVRMPSESSSTSEDQRLEEKEEPSRISENDNRTESDYESDFEGDSVTSFKGVDVEEVEGREDKERGIIPCVKKLSTISEVDSELEKKVSETDARIKTKADNPSPTAVAEVQKEVIDATHTTGAVAAIDVPKNGAISNDITEVLNKAFEKGIAYTLQHQRNALEATKVKEVTQSDNDLDRASSSSTSRNSIINEKLKNKQASSPKSNRSVNLHSDQLKVVKSRSDASESPQKSSSTEVVASLKEVLSALKDQFARTESLAEKLTENVKDMNLESQKRESPRMVPRDAPPDPWPTVGGSSFLDSALVTNLQKTRKDVWVEPHLISLKLPLMNANTVEDNLKDRRHKTDLPEPSFLKSGRSRANSNENTLSTPGVSEGVSSEGEVNLNTLRSLASDRKRKGPAKSESSSNSESSFIRISSRKKSSRVSSGRSGNAARRKITSPLALGSNNEEMSFSEGEVASAGLLDADVSSIQSLGEVISEHISAASSVE